MTSGNAGQRDGDMAAQRDARPLIGPGMMGPGARFVYGYDTVRQRRAVPLLSDEWPRLREGDDVTALTGRVRPASVRRTGA